MLRSWPRPPKAGGPSRLFISSREPLNLRLRPSALPEAVSRAIGPLNCGGAVLSALGLRLPGTLSPEGVC